MSGFLRRRGSDRQAVFPFVSRTDRRDRQFRRSILLITAVTVVGIISASSELRSWLFISGSRIQSLLLMALGAPSSDRPLSDQEWTDRRARNVRKADQALDNFFSISPPEVLQLFEQAGMSPGSALNRWGRGDQVFMFSSKVFQVDDRGRSYGLRPNTRSVWLRELNMKGGPHGLLLIPDTPELRRLASRAGAIVVEESVQTTNSWGLRGPEPNLDAKVRVMVLGDSFMEGMFIGDDVTPPLLLERHLSREWNTSVCVLNTGHVGYSPEQYYYTYLEYADRFRPQFVVLSVCHNDFGDDSQVLEGKGDLYDEAAYWINQMLERCRGNAVAFLIVPVPHREQIDITRSNGHYPGRLFDFVKLGPNLAISLLDDFIDENLRLKNEAREKGGGFPESILYNVSIKDGHFSPLGSALWARLVVKRISRLISPAKLGRQFFNLSAEPVNQTSPDGSR